jgi:hypothetical protein
MSSAIDYEIDAHKKPHPDMRSRMAILAEQNNAKNPLHIKKRGQRHQVQLPQKSKQRFQDFDCKIKFRIPRLKSRCRIPQ